MTKYNFVFVVLRSIFVYWLIFFGIRKFFPDIDKLAIYNIGVVLGMTIAIFNQISIDIWRMENIDKGKEK